MIPNKKLQEMHDIISRAVPDATPGSREWSQQFGELIVRECIYVIEHQGSPYHKEHIAKKFASILR